MEDRTILNMIKGQNEYFKTWDWTIKREFARDKGNARISESALIKNLKATSCGSKIK